MRIKRIEEKIYIFYVEYSAGKDHPECYILPERDGAGDTVLALAKQSEGKEITVRALEFPDEKFYEEFCVELAKKAKGRLIKIEDPRMIPDFELEEN